MEEDVIEHKKRKEEGTGKLESYILGFVLSIVLTLIAYFFVAAGLISGWTLVISVGALALVQVLIQLLFFLHLGEEPSPPWNLIIFLFMLLIVLVIVMGSIWIMYNLDYRMGMESSGIYKHKEYYQESPSTHKEKLKK